MPKIKRVPTLIWSIVTKDKNIGNYGYIGTSILRIYQRII